MPRASISPPPTSTRRRPASSSARTPIATTTSRAAMPNPEAYRNAHAVRLTGLLAAADVAARPSSSSGRTCARRAWSSCSTSCSASRSRRTARKALGLMSERRLGHGADTWSLTTGVDLEWADSFLLEDQDGPTTDGSPAANAIRPAGQALRLRRALERRGGLRPGRVALHSSAARGLAGLRARIRRATTTTTACSPATRTTTACRARRPRLSLQPPGRSQRRVSPTSPRSSAVRGIRDDER